MKLEIDITLNELNQFDIYLSSENGSGISIKEDTIESAMSKLNSYIESEINYSMYFKVNGVDVISRADYESLSMPICTKNVSNNVMQDIANEIFNTIKINFGENNAIAYFSNNDEELEENEWERMNETFYDIMESIGLNYGLNYYESEN